MIGPRLTLLFSQLALCGALIAQETAREQMQNSVETPKWTNPKGFEKDVFTFVRIRYSTGNRTYHPSDTWFGGGRRGGRRGSMRWRTDFPDAELNLSYRLQQMTSLKVDPSCRVLELTDPELFVSLLSTSSNRVIWRLPRRKCRFSGVTSSMVDS